MVDTASILNARPADIDAGSGDALVLAFNRRIAEELALKTKTSVRRLKNGTPEQNVVIEAMRQAQSEAILVNAVAGSGKTTTILEGLRSANRTAPDVSTVHALGMRTLRAGRVQMGRNAVSNFKAGDWFTRGGGASYLTGDEEVDAAMTEAFKELQSWCKLGGIGLADAPPIDEDFVAEFDNLHGVTLGLDDEHVTDVHMAVANYLEWCLTPPGHHRIDFDDMLWLPLILCPDSIPRYSMVVVDEAQDLNITRRALAFGAVAEGGSFVAVGDPHQAIYAFAGADNDSMDQLQVEIKRSLPHIQQITTYPLTCSFRCSKAVITEAQKLVPHIRANSETAMGKVLEKDDPDYPDDLPWRDLDHARQSVVLCRTNRPLVAKAFSLIRQGIPANIEGRDIGKGLLALTKKWKSVTDLDALSYRLTSYFESAIQKAERKKKESQAAALRDQQAVMSMFIVEVQKDGNDSIGALRVKIQEMFTDSTVEGRKGWLFSTLHKAKGLEWLHVYILQPEDIPAQWSKHPEQENNLLYVGITRAILTLTYIGLRPHIVMNKV